mmetsp:Transcript_3602/g.9818  ORF Transcript_3602/g.9818 Transcript_3602/m.9818 type:complete len:212 (-) Transcript_3602:40-675(-)
MEARLLQVVLPWDMLAPASLASTRAPFNASFLAKTLGNASRLKSSSFSPLPSRARRLRDGVVMAASRWACDGAVQTGAPPLAPPAGLPPAINKWMSEGADSDLRGGLEASPLSALRTKRLPSCWRPRCFSALKTAGCVAANTSIRGAGTDVELAGNPKPRRTKYAPSWLPFKRGSESAARSFCSPPRRLATTGVASGPASARRGIGHPTHQ